MHSNYSKWDKLDREMAEEEAAELAARKKEKQRAQAERQRAAGAAGKPKDLGEAYERAFHEKKGEMKLTGEEVEKFSKAFKDPKFKEMMTEYMDEISDPQYREEQEAYIRQLERDQKAPEGKKFITVTPGFVVKTRKVEKAGSHGQ